MVYVCCTAAIGPPLASGASTRGNGPAFHAAELTNPAPRTAGARKPRQQVGGRSPYGIKDLVSQLKRDRIISAAIDLFYTQGYTQTTLDQVAKSLGVTKPFIYQYFGSKNDVLAEICSRAIKDAHETINRALSQRGTPTEKLKIIVRDFTLHVLNNQANAIIYSREETELAPKDRETINHLRREFDRRLVALLQEGLKRTSSSSRTYA